MHANLTFAQAQSYEAIARVAQENGTWVVYEAGDELPSGLFGQPVDPNPVPYSITKRQLYRGLMQVGWLGATMPAIDAAIVAMISAMPESVREVARVEFFTSRDYLRANPLLVAALSSPPLSKTSAQIDDFFRLCESFPAEGG